MELFLVYLLMINLLAFFICGYDKSAAIHNRRRIPEKTLFTLAAAGGAIGLYMGMFFFRHKTKHASFRIGIPAVLMIQFALIWFFFLKNN